MGRLCLQDKFRKPGSINGYFVIWQSSRVRCTFDYMANLVNFQKKTYSKNNHNDLYDIKICIIFFKDAYCYEISQVNLQKVHISRNDYMLNLDNFKVVK